MQFIIQIYIVISTPIPKNTLPCPEGEVKPPMSNLNIQKYNRQSDIQNDDSGSFDESNKNLENNVEKMLIERTEFLKKLNNEGFENGLINSSTNNEMNQVESHNSTKNQVSVLGVDSSSEKDYIPPEKDENINDEENIVVEDKSGIEPIDSFDKLNNVKSQGFSIEEKEKLEKINDLEELYNKKLVIQKTLTNPDDLVESVTYITIDSADRNRLYIQTHTLIQYYLIQLIIHIILVF